MSEASTVERNDVERNESRETEPDEEDDQGIIPIPIPDLPESGIKLSTISGLPQCLTLRLTLRLIVQPIKLVNLRCCESRQCPMTPLTTVAPS